MNYFLSVVVPCFNCGKNFLDYYQSVLDRVDDVEFVIVDDCSTDGSYELLKRSITKSNFKIIQNVQNSGPGYSRNVGVANANGTFITFLDSDDRFDDSFFGFIKRYASMDVDLIYFDYKSVDKNGSRINRMLFANSKETDLENVLVFSRGCPWGKVYRTSILKAHNIRFLDLKRNEDMPFTKVAISYCRKVLYVDKPLYLYFQNENSLMHNDSLFDNKNTIMAWNYIDSNLSTEISKEAKNAIYLREYVVKKSLYDLKVLKRKGWIAEVNEMLADKTIMSSNKYIKSFPFLYRVAFFLIYHKCFFLLKVLHK